MNRSIYWRLAWKEYRLQRSLWIAMTALAGAAALLVFKFVAQNPDVRPSDRWQWLFMVALGFPAFYLLGCGATLFAGEREARTFEFQRGLPVAARRVFAVKTAFAIMSAALMFGLMWLLAGWLSRGLPASPADSAPNPAILAALMACFGLEMFLWATLFSLLSSRVLLAAVLGVAAASVSTELLGNLYNVMHGDSATLPAIALITVLVAAADFRLGTRWFDEKVDRRPRPARAKTAGRAPASATGPSCRFRTAGRAAVRRLVWQHWRQSRGMVFAVAAMLIPLVLFGVERLINAPPYYGAHYYGENRVVLELVAFMLPGLALTGAPVLGLCVFLPDQRGRSLRFLADRGVQPKYVWLSRQLLVAAFGVVYAAVAALAILSLSGRGQFVAPYTEKIPAILGRVFGYVALGVSVGQFGSMLFRSGVLAGLFSIVLTAVLAGWCWLMSYLQISWWWSALPIPLSLFLATRFRTEDWLVERNTLRSWLRPGLALLLPAGLILTAVSLYRAYQIPLVDPGFSPEEYARRMTSEERATLDLYRQATAKLVLPPMEPARKEPENGDREQEVVELLRILFPLSPEGTAFVNANQASLALVLKATRGKVFNSVDESECYSGIHEFELFRLLIYSAAKLEEEGRLDAAMEQYLAGIRFASQFRRLDLARSSISDLLERGVYAHMRSWAARPKQTPERLIVATRQVERLSSNLPPNSNWIKAEYLRIHRFLAGDSSALKGSAFFGGESMPPLTTFWLHLPWERARALRLLNLLARRQLDALSVAEAESRDGRRIPQPEVPPDQAGRLESPYVMHRAINLPPLDYDLSTFFGEAEMVGGYTAMEVCRRAMILTLALDARKLRHGSLPKSLDELVGPCLERLPMDPYSGEPFRYFRHGVKVSLQWHCPARAATWDMEKQTTAPNTPFIWSTGPNVAAPVAPPDARAVDRYRLIRCDRADGLPGSSWRTPESEIEVWESGWPFPIP